MISVYKVVSEPYLRAREFGSASSTGRLGTLFPVAFFALVLDEALDLLAASCNWPVGSLPVGPRPLP
jgi:hypothetical protein